MAKCALSDLTQCQVTRFERSDWLEVMWLALNVLYILIHTCTAPTPRQTQTEDMLLALHKLRQPHFCVNFLDCVCSVWYDTLTDQILLGHFGLCKLLSSSISGIYSGALLICTSEMRTPPYQGHLYCGLKCCICMLTNPWNQETWTPSIVPRVSRLERFHCTAC